MFRLSFFIFSLAFAAILVFGISPIILDGSDNPRWQKIFLGNQAAGLRALLEEKRVLNEALANADRIKDKIAELNRAEASISDEDLAKLDKFIPDHVDNINLIIDLNNIATEHGLKLADVKARSTPTGGLPAGQNQISETAIAFSVTGDYTALGQFLKGLANSLRVVDVTNLAFTVGPGGINKYDFEVKTYWVK